MLESNRDRDSFEVNLKVKFKIFFNFQGMIRALQRSNQLLTMPAKVLSVNYSSTNPQNLPRLPVPKLNDTLSKFLDTAEPHLTPERFENTKNIVREFGKSGGIGEKLQKLLEQRAATKENWLSDPTSNWWLDCAYLQYRDPVVVWSSPGLVFPMQKFATIEDKIKYAGLVVHGEFPQLFSPAARQ
jgi:hypothetical protein